MIKLGIVMDPIASININKDSSFAMLLEAQRRGYEIHYMEISFLYLRGNDARAFTRLLSVKKDGNPWYNFYSDQDIKLNELDIILMRKDPPVNTEFIYVTYILEHAEDKGVLVVNKPQNLRNCNEKIFTSWFPRYMPDTLLSQRYDHIYEFWKEHGEIILKPLNSMGGNSIFHIKENDPNFSVIVETLTCYGCCFCMAQEYLPAIKEGDKRVLIIDGQPVPYCLARIPKQGETRGNLSAGGYGEARFLSKSDQKIAHNIAKILKKKGLIFVGLDIIGDRLTEINITSPTCLREIEAAFPISITGMLMESIEKKLALKR
ncbi:glutathione synthase [Candidatus Curculioniphilus buchneri]|uniref:glutathione synthase n=1 Tax=Candidatus Curculioniphilus buchneri TaxID=690594 RepID=UPI00376F0E9C